MSRPLLVFDMDGVLVDVTESYRETIARTVEHFTGAKPSNEQIQDFKNEGGWNNDWELSHHMATRGGAAVAFDAVVEYFQSIYLGDGSGGLMSRERWVAQPGKLEKLAETFHFAVFTGRTKEEAQLTLDRFAQGLVFDPVVGMYDVERHKPDPEGLLHVTAKYPGAASSYIGDTVDDARAAKAAGVPFIGIAAPSNPRYIDLVFLFQEIGAHAIVDDINYLEEVFAS